MIIREQKPYKVLIISMIDKLSNINQWRRDVSDRNTHPVYVYPRAD